MDHLSLGALALCFIGALASAVWMALTGIKRRGDTFSAPLDRMELPFTVAWLFGMGALAVVLIDAIAYAWSD